MSETRPDYNVRLCGDGSSSSGSSERVVDTQDFDFGGYNFNFRGRVTLNGETVSHYVSDTYGSPSEGGARSSHFEEYAGSTEEFWIDDSHYIVQIRRNLVVNMPRLNYSATSTTTIRLSGFDEVNTITAPGEPTATPVPTPTATPEPTPEPTPVPTTLDGAPRAESRTQTTVTISWDRLRPEGESVRDYRVNYRRYAHESWTFGAYVDWRTFSDRRPQAVVPRSSATPLACNTEYEFQAQVKLSNGWNDYGTVTARTAAC